MPINTLNSDKTQYIIFHRHKLFTYPINKIEINGKSIREANQTKFLGVIINKHLYCHYHIQIIHSEIAKLCGLISLTRNHFNRGALMSLYYTLVYLNITYRLTVWDGASKTSLNPIVLIQKRVEKVINNLWNCGHTNNAFKELKLLTFNDINTLICAVYTYKCLNCPDTFPNYFPNITKKHILEETTLDFANHWSHPPNHT